MNEFKTLNEYLVAALAKARFEPIEDGVRIYAEIPGFRGVWAEGKTRKEAAIELREVLKGWIELELERGHKLPRVNGIALKQLTVA